MYSVMGRVLQHHGAICSVLSVAWAARPNMRQVCSKCSIKWTAALPHPPTRGLPQHCGNMVYHSLPQCIFVGRSRDTDTPLLFRGFRNILATWCTMVYHKVLL
jgi:hypothetical protein